MRAMQLEAPRRPLRLVEVPVPEPGRGQVLVRVRACAVCRTDLHVVEGELPPRKTPVIPGHQVVGTVERCGARARRFAVSIASIARYRSGEAQLIEVTAS